MQTEQAIEIDRHLDEISKKISFYLVNPINVAEEKEKFFASNTYNPFFEYMPAEVDFKDLKEKLTEEIDETSVISQLLNQKRIEYLKKVELLSNIGKETFPNSSYDVYGLPSDDLVAKSMDLLNLEEDQPEQVICSCDVVSIFSQAMKAYGFDWNVVEKKMISGAAVSPSKKTLYIRENSTFSREFIKRLIVHEIGTHALRAENGYLQNFTMFRRGFPGYMSTEEGLAVVNEELHGVLNKKTLKVYAGRVIAVKLAQNHSFREIYNALSKNFDSDSAWRITLRVKRGLSDTSKGGGLTKDYLYLDGYYKVKKFIEEGNDVRRLYTGKIGIEHVDMLDRINVIEPRYFPKYEMVENGAEIRI